MADFTQQDVSPIQGGVSVKPGVSSVPTAVPSNQTFMAAGNSAMSNLGDVAKIGMNYLQIQQQQNQNKVISEYQQKLATLADGVDQGVLSSAQARQQGRALYTQYQAQFPIMTDAITKAHGEFMSDSGLGGIMNTGTIAEQEQNKLKQEAASAGFTNPAHIGNPQLEAQDVQNYLQFKRGGEELARNTAIINNAQAQVSYKTSLSQQQLTNLNLQVEQGKVASMNAMANMSGAFNNNFNGQVSNIIQNVQSGKMTKEDGIIAIQNGLATYRSIAGQVGMNAGGDYINALMKPNEDIANSAISHLNGTTSKAILDNDVNAATAKAQLQILADPSNAKVIATTNLFKTADLSTLPQVQNSVINILKNNSTPGGRIADPMPKNDQEAKDFSTYLGLIKSGMASYNDPNNVMTKDAKAEIDTHAINLLQGVNAYSNAVQHPQEYNQIVDMLASNEFGKYASGKGGVPAQTAANTWDVLRQQYGDVVLPMIKQKFQDAGVNVVPMGGYGAGPDSSMDASKLISAQFTGAGVSFSINKGASMNTQDGGSVDDTDLRRKVNDLNQTVAPVLNRLMRVQAHLEGNMDYKKQWDNNYAPMFMPKQDPNTQGEVNANSGDSPK